MFRRSIFLFLTAFLVVILVWLFVKSRSKQEPDRVPLSGETVRESKPTLTRVLLPQDLEILESHVELKRSVGGAGAVTEKRSLAANHTLVIRNNGKVAYGNIMLEFSYLGVAGRVLDRKTRVISEAILPGKTLSVRDLLMEGLPAKTAKTTVRILYSDMLPP